MSSLRVFVLSFICCVVIKAEMDVLVIADWGGRQLSPYTTPQEVATAKIMSEISKTVNPQMIWALGDNFYDTGIHSQYDPRIQATFEDVFNDPSINTLPFYVVAGNHDHVGNVSGEIAYSNMSQRWTFPDYWYSTTWNIPDTSYTLQLVMIDTVLACGMTMDEEWCNNLGISYEDCLIQPKGPENAKVADEQWDWIANQLNTSTASYLIVAGHYPIWSIAEHGPTECLVEQLRPMLIENKVNFYMSGHDHTFEYIVEDGLPNLGYVDTGGSHLCNSKTSHSNDIPDGSLKFHGCDYGGFTRVHIDNQGLFIEYYFGNDTNVQFTTPTHEPRM